MDYSSIEHGDNALTLDWNDVLPAERASYVFGNPPFVGAKFMDDAQREDAQRVFASSSPTAPFSGATKQKAWRQCIASSSAFTSPRPQAGEGPGVRGRG